MDNIGQLGQFAQFGQCGQNWTIWPTLDKLNNKGLEKKNDTILIKWTEIQFDKWPNRSVENCSKW